MLEVLDAYAQKGGKTLFAEASFNIMPGEVVALLAPNGAGKTTLMRVVAGDRVRGCFARVLEGDRALDRAGLRRAVYYTDGAGRLLYPSQSCRWHLEALRSVWRSPRTVEQAALACGVGGYLDEKASRLSRGMSQKLSLALAFMSGAPYLLLDEPSDGLDAQAGELFAEVVGRLSSEGAGVLVSTHDVGSAASLCDRALFLTGRGIFEATCVQDDPDGLYRTYSEVYA